jgi:hypothetical protein
MAAKTKQLSGTITISLDKTPDLPGDKDRILLAAQTLEVVDDATYQRGADLREAALGRVKVVEEFFAADKKTSHGLWKSICDKITLLSAPYKQVLQVIEPKMKTWRLAEEAKIAEAAKEIESANEDVKVDLALQAKLARRNGDIALAKQLEAQMRDIPTEVALPSVKPEVENLTERRAWIGVCDKPMETIVAVAEGRTPLLHVITVRGEVREEPLLIVNPAVVLFYARKLEREMSAYLPGCHAEQDLTFAGKGGRS